MRRFRSRLQADAKDCAPTCLAMIAEYYGIRRTVPELRRACGITRAGVSIYGFNVAARALGFRTLSARITFDQLFDEMLLPCALFMDNRHMVVLYKVRRTLRGRRYYIADPAVGRVVYSEQDLFKHWISGTFEGDPVGVAIQLEPSTEMLRGGRKKKEGETDKSFGLRHFADYILPHKWQMAQLLFSAIVVMLLGYVSPFITQAVVDVGVLGRDLHFIVLMMVVQLVIFFSKTAIVFVQGWLSLHMNTVINVNLIGDYLRKLSRMPLSFFETRTLGDILQRIADHDRIKNFLMNDLVDVVFSLATFVTFTLVMAFYDLQILAIFLAGNALYVVWIMLFLKTRRRLDNKSFGQYAAVQNNVVQFVESMPEIKLGGIESQKCWEWMHHQARLYKLSRTSMRLGQVQSLGAMLFTTTTGIIISYIVACRVVDGEMTLGMMMSLSFILGQVAAPISSFIGFVLDYQDARISLERLSDLHIQGDETSDDGAKRHTVPSCHDLDLRGVSFSYSGMDEDNVLHDITLHIPQGKVTALVGQSGCGKTTLLRLLEGFYDPTAGTVSVGGVPLADIQKDVWRRSIGSVMQGGYVFSDTIANNIVLYDPDFSAERMREAAACANLLEFVDTRVQGFSTRIGTDGIGLSQGQRQRILLARVVYKRPDFVFLDEATNALDTKNETDIMRSLQSFFQGRTVVVAAHRLSTVRQADNIVVISGGRVVEQGTHEALVARRGHYYELVRAQINFFVKP